MCVDPANCDGGCSQCAEAAMEIVTELDRINFGRKYVKSLEDEVGILRHALSVVRDYLSVHDNCYYLDGDGYDYFNLCICCRKKEGRCDDDCQRKLVIELLSKTV